MNTLLALAIAIGAGLLFSRLVRPLHLPNVTAFLVAGLIIGPSVLGIIPSAMVDSFGVITEVALGMIAYAIGAEFRLDYLKKIGSKPITITFFQGVAAVVLVDVALILCGFPVPLALTLGAIATATAPAATLMVIRQYKAKGTVSDMLLPVVAMDDALGLMVFSISVAVAQAVASGVQITAQALVIAPMIEIVGSLLLGGMLGIVLTLCARYFHSRGNKLALELATVFLALALCSMWGLSSLLVCMMVGAVMVNTSRSASVLIEQSDRFTPPLFLLFFVISGASLNLKVLTTVGVLGLLYVIVRSFGKYFGAWLGAFIVKTDANVRKYLGFALLPQAGVAIGMAQLALAALPEYGQQIQAVVLAATLVYELFGPVVTKIALTKAGEIPSAKAKA